MNRRTALTLLLVIILLGVGLRVYQLVDRSLWFDEAFSWRLIQFSFSEMLERAAADVHPPMYYILLKGWTVVFGTTLLALRSFSVTLAAATIALAYVFGTTAFRTRVSGLVAALLLAVSGWQIAFAWEARMYTLGTAFALLSSWLLLKAMRASLSPVGKKTWLTWWLAYGLTAAAFAYVHYFALFTLAGHAIFVVIRLIGHSRWRIGEVFHSRVTWGAVVAAVVAAFAYLPWIGIFIRQNSQVQASYWVPPIGGWSIPDTFYRFFVPTSLIPPHLGLAALIAALPIALVALIWLWLSFARPATPRQTGLPRDAAQLVVLAALVPFLLAILVSFVGQSLYQDRFLVFAHLFILIALAAVITRLIPTRLRRIAGLLLTVGLLATFVRYSLELSIGGHPGARGATEYIAKHSAPDEAILVSSPFIYFAIDHYAQEEFTQLANPHLLQATGDLAHFAGGPILTADDIVTDAYLADIDRLWLVDTSGFGSVKRILPNGWQATQSETFSEVFPHQGDVFVTRYEKR